MPQLGEIRKGTDAGYNSPKKVIWHACEKCGRCRWVFLRNGRPQSRWCYPCGRREGKPRGGKWREESARWKGGRHVTAGGYVQIVVPLDDPLLVMADTRGRIYEHRLVIARHLGRPLESEEQVHHKNGDKQDNRPENLELTTRSEHIAGHHREIHELRARVKELERELREARSS